MLKTKALIPAVAALAIAVTPFVTTHAAIQPRATLGGITFASGTNGCTGPLVGVYGSSALQKFILATAKDYCNTFANKATAPDVEYASGGDSCPGVDFAADNSDANEIGASDVFAPACTGSLARPTSKIKDNNISVNVVNALAICPGAQVPQGGTVAGRVGGTPIQCAGNGSAAAGSAAFGAPNNLSASTAQQLFNNALVDYSQIGGTAGVAPTIQNRSVGSGTRATWCLNVFGPGNDLCAGSVAAQGTTGGLLTAVCGNPYASPATPPADGNGAIGYVTRSGIVIDSRQPSGGLAPVQNCGVVGYQGYSALNGACDPVNPGATPSLSAANPGSGVTNCNGDLQVAEAQYPAWGYEHLDLNAASTNNSAAQGYINYVGQSGPEEAQVQTYGFIRNCQMLFQRGVDAGPVSAASNTTC